MKFNPKHVYGQSIIVDTSQDIVEDLFWEILENYVNELKEIVPKELLYRVAWEVTEYPKLADDLIYNYRHKYWKVIYWKYQPEREKLDERV